MKLKGQSILWYVQVGEQMKSIAFCTNSTISMDSEVTGSTQNKDEESEEGAAFTDQEVKSLSWSGQSDHLVAIDGSAKGATFDDIFSIWKAGKKVPVFFGRKGTPLGENGWADPSAWKYSGNVIITNLQLTAQCGEEATYSVSFTGCGELKNN